MKRTLWTATKLLTNQSNFKFILSNYLMDILIETENMRTWLHEGDAVEITHKDITISFTWDMISAVNNKTNECIDLISVTSTTQIIDFFKNGGIN